MQKYRLYLKRLSAVASHQASIVAALGGSDPFMHMSAFEGLQSYQGFTSSAALSSFSPQGLLTRNNPTSFGIQGMAASRPIQIASVNSTISHSIGDTNKYHKSGYKKKPMTYLLSFLGMAWLMVCLAHSEVSQTVLCCSKTLLNADRPT
jgi:hypothetical protein